MDSPVESAMAKGTDLNAPAAVLTTHVLDMSRGAPGSGMRIALSRVEGASASLLADVTANADGRCDAPLLTSDNAEAGTYRLDFHVDQYLGAEGGFFGIVPIEFNIADVAGHYHVPLVLAPWGYSTYRGAPPARPPDDRGQWNAGLGGTDGEGDWKAAAPPGSAPPGLTTHVIDIARGCGAGGLAVDVRRLDPEGGGAEPLRTCLTTAEGRTSDWLVPAGGLEVGTYELVFHLADYFGRAAFGVGAVPFFAVARIRFWVSDPGSHHHVPLLAAPWGYTTYRGS
jgi:5-hydroxyisourate hydrolase